MTHHQRQDTADIADKSGRLLHFSVTHNRGARFASDKEVGPVEQTMVSTQGGALNGMKGPLRAPCAEDGEQSEHLQSAMACAEDAKCKWPRLEISASSMDFCRFVGAPPKDARLRSLTNAPVNLRGLASKSRSRVRLSSGQPSGSKKFRTIESGINGRMMPNVNFGPRWNAMR